MTEQRSWSFIRCPACQGELQRAPDAAQCARCRQAWSIVDGVLRCVPDDAFYEENFRNTIRHQPGKSRAKDWIFFHLMQSGAFGQLRKKLTPDSVVLDVGCASGVRWLGDFHTIGVDLSFGAVRATRDFYEVSVQASADRLPLAPQSVDAVYSSYFFEHLTVDDKDRCLAELARVARPGAACVLLFDTASKGAFGRFARRDPDAFQRGFIEKDGHVGLAPLSQTLAQLERAGFRVERAIKFGTTPLQYLASYVWLDTAYGDVIPWVRRVGNAARAISSSRWRLPVELGTTAFDLALDRFADPDDATRALVIARREARATVGSARREEAPQLGAVD